MCVCVRLSSLYTSQDVGTSVIWCTSMDKLHWHVQRLLNSLCHTHGAYYMNVLWLLKIKPISEWRPKGVALYKPCDLILGATWNAVTKELDLKHPCSAAAVTDTWVSAKSSVCSAILN